jgi:hypothetical protein
MAIQAIGEARGAPWGIKPQSNMRIAFAPGPTISARSFSTATVFAPSFVYRGVEVAPNSDIFDAWIGACGLQR